MNLFWEYYCISHSSVHWLASTPSSDTALKQWSEVWGDHQIPYHQLLFARSAILETILDAFLSRRRPLYQRLLLAPCDIVGNLLAFLHPPQPQVHSIGAVSHQPEGCSFCFRFLAIVRCTPSNLHLSNYDPQASHSGLSIEHASGCSAFSSSSTNEAKSSMFLIL